MNWAFVNSDICFVIPVFFAIARMWKGEKYRNLFPLNEPGMRSRHFSGSLLVAAESRNDRYRLLTE